MKRTRVAIIGAGFSGAVLAAHLARRGAPVTLIGKGRRFGTGLAYGTKDRGHLLNVRASNMSAFPDRPDHFVRWLAKRGRGDASTRFAQRAEYGAYIEHVLRRAPRWFSPGITHVRAEVTRCARDGEKWAIELAKGETLFADAVVLALGNPPATAPAAFRGGDTPLLDPWDVQGMRRIPRGDVLLLGTGLTAVDVALSLSRMRRKGVIYALSRRGQLPRAHLQNATPAAPQAMVLPLPLSEALFTLRKQAEAAAARGEPWQHVMDQLRARTPELWQRLPADSQQRFLRHLRPWWDAHRHRMAPQIAAEVARLQDEGRLRVLVGEVASAERAGAVIHVQHRQRGSFARHRIEVAGVVNCTGASMDLSTSNDPLVRQMFDEGIVRAPASGLGVDVDPAGRVIAAGGSVQANLYALGPITQGVFWESTAVPEIRVRAAALAMLLAPDR
jgi:uncharacterized NAD(P)/FAD-binding protein YdhS